MRFMDVLRTTGLALAVWMLVIPGVHAAEEDETLGVETLDVEEITFVSQAGVEVVGRIDAARTAMDRNDWTRARFQAAKARTILGHVREKSPSLRLQDRISAALKELKSGSQPKEQTLLPVYAELDKVTRKENVAEVREYVDKAKAGAAQGDLEVAEDHLVEALVRIRYLEIDLPIEETHSRLNRAIHEITRHEMLAAKATLRDAESHIQTVVVATSSVDVEETEAVSGGPE